jgi:hypothetical protein
LSPFLNALTTSFTPRFSCLTFDDFFTVLKIFFDSFLFARGDAMGEMASRGTANSGYTPSSVQSSVLLSSLFANWTRGL